MKTPGFTRMLAFFSLLTAILLGGPSIQAAREISIRRSSPSAAAPC